jgi:hypothetical protein
MAAEAGRGPDELPVTIWGPADDIDQLKRYRDIGVARVVVSLQSEQADKVLPELDLWAKRIPLV